jgi:hypothetical protein
MLLTVLHGDDNHDDEGLNPLSTGRIKIQNILVVASRLHFFFSLLRNSVCFCAMYSSLHKCNPAQNSNNYILQIKLFKSKFEFILSRLTKSSFKINVVI